MKKHILMIKQATSGLKYLCKTTTEARLNPYVYRGSGKYWLKHIRKNKSWIITCVIGTYDTSQQLAKAGEYYSSLYNVAESKDWANLIPETGNGGWINDQTGRRWKVKDTSNMRGGVHLKGVSNTSVKGIRNHQFKGQIITPWGTFYSYKDALYEAKMLKTKGRKDIITDRNTLRKYCQIENGIPLTGNRTFKKWRNKTPKQIGFNFEQAR